MTNLKEKPQMMIPLNKKTCFEGWNMILGEDISSQTSLMHINPQRNNLFRDTRIKVLISLELDQNTDY